MQLRPLLLRHAVRTMVLLSSIMKLIYYKHAMTACALEAWMVHNEFSSWRDPTDPFYAAFFNLAVFASAIAYAVEDHVSSPEVASSSHSRHSRHSPEVAFWAFAAVTAVTVWRCRSSRHSRYSPEVALREHHRLLPCGAASSAPPPRCPTATPPHRLTASTPLHRRSLFTRVAHRSRR